MKKLFKVDYYLDTKKVYDCSYSFHHEPNDDDLRAIMRVTHPDIEFNKVEWKYIRDCYEGEL